MISSIWTEKYRPSNFTQIKGQKEIVAKIQAFVKSGSMPHLLFSGPAGVGKCVTGDTPIITGSGEVKQIKDCYEQKTDTVMTLGSSGKITTGKVAYFYKDKAKSLISIKTSSGKHLKITPEHPFLVLKDGIPTWTEAKDVGESNLIASPLKIQPTIKEESINWKAKPCYWAKLNKTILCAPNSVFTGVKKKVLKCMEVQNNITNKEISQIINVKRNVVEWATRELVKENVIISKNKNPQIFNLIKNKIFTDEIPFNLVNENGLINGIKWRSGTKKPLTTIKYFTKTSPEFYEWLGLVYGDGHIRNSSIRFYNKNSKLRARFKELSNIIFGEGLIWQEKERKGVPYLEILQARVITSMFEHFFNITLGTKKSDKITVPPALFIADDKKVASFIRGFYECDGCFSNNSVELSSASKIFISGLNYLLLRWGIDSRIKRRKNQSYLIIHNVKDINEFDIRVKPFIKNISLNRTENTNTDIMEVSLKYLNPVLRNLGIKQQELGEKGSISYVFERKKASRKKVQHLYSTACQLARERLNVALETISLCENLKPELNEQLGNLWSQLGNSQQRSKIDNLSHIRYDCLKDYHESRREPNLTNLLRIVKAMKQLQCLGADETYSNLTQTILLRKKIVNSLSLLDISYNEVATAMNDSSANINNLLNQDGLSLQAVKKVCQLFSTIKSIIEKRVFSEQLIESLELLEYLSKVELRWECVLLKEDIGGGEVYDLNVQETHNFIGGKNGPLVLHNTTLSLVIAKQLFGENWRQNTLELNASDERGIDVVRVKVKDFARTKAIGDVPFKLIYLDESDALTKEAQQALRRTMENYTKTCRFILSCNYSSKIIDPIQSRCAIFRFKPLPEDEIYSVIDTVSKEEGLTVSDEAKKALFEVCDGDCRRLENIMQSCAVIKTNLDAELVYSMASVAKPKEVNEVLSIAAQGNFLESRKKLLSLMLDYGLSGLDIIKQIQREIWNLELDDRKKVELVDKCGEVEFRMVEGSDEYLQLESFLAYVVLVGSK